MRFCAFYRIASCARTAWTPARGFACCVILRSTTALDSASALLACFGAWHADRSEERRQRNLMAAVTSTAHRLRVELRRTICEDVEHCPVMRPASIPGATASLLVWATTLLYVVLVDSQGSADSQRVTAWGISLATCGAVASTASWSRRPEVRSIMLAMTGGALLGLGGLGIFSIGLLLIVSGTLLIVGARAAVVESPSRFSPVAFALGATALIAVPVLVLWIA
jgi:hypothetical protein